MSLRFALTAAALICAPVITTTPAFAGSPVYTGTFSNTAVQGYDPVAYFTEGKPIKGDKNFSTSYHGADFRFSSQENLDTFLADPGTYAPQYGGYCAWAAAQGKKAPGKADYWAIVDGKLYLNYSEKVQKDWNKDRTGFITKADSRWVSLKDK